MRTLFKSLGLATALAFYGVVGSAQDDKATQTAPKQSAEKQQSAKNKETRSQNRQQDKSQTTADKTSDQQPPNSVAARQRLAKQRADQQDASKQGDETKKSQTKRQSGESRSSQSNRSNDREQGDETKSEGHAAYGAKHRLSEIQGMEVKADDQKLASIKDIVIDVLRGKVKYAALTGSEELGKADELVAIPWNALNHQHPEGKEGHVMVLDIDQKKLQDAPSFPEADWPSFAGNEFGGKIAKHFGDGSDSKVTIKVGSVPVKVDINREQARDGEIVHRASDLTGKPVHDSEGNELGSVKDLVIEMGNGDVRLAALQLKEATDDNSKLCLVPWSSFQCEYDAKSEQAKLVLPFDASTLRAAPNFASKNWPDLARDQIVGDVNQYFARAQKRRAFGRPQGEATKRTDSEAEGESSASESASKSASEKELTEEEAREKRRARAKERVEQEASSTSDEKTDGDQ